MGSFISRGYTVLYQYLAQWLLSSVHLNILSPANTPLSTLLHLQLNGMKQKHFHNLHLLQTNLTVSSVWHVLTVWVQPGEMDTRWASELFYCRRFGSALLWFIGAAAILSTILDDVQQLTALQLGYTPFLRFRGLLPRSQPSCPLINRVFHPRWGWHTECHTEGEDLFVKASLLILWTCNGILVSQVWVEPFSVFQLPFQSGPRHC